MAKYVGYKRPKDTKKTIRHLLVYLGMHKWSFLLVALLVLISAGANITGTYLLKPVINRFIVPGDLNGLVRAVAAMGVMYLCGALATLGYNRLMVKTSQKVIREIRRINEPLHQRCRCRTGSDEQQLCNDYPEFHDAFWYGDNDDGTQYPAVADCCGIFNCYVCGYPLKRKAQQKIF